MMAQRPARNRDSLLDTERLITWAWHGLDELTIRRELLNELNLFPVPDGDTGANIGAFWAGFACDLLDTAESLGELVAIAAQRNFRVPGNSATITYAWLQGLAERLPEATADQLSLVEALGRAAERARAAVLEPREGTMLTVFDATAVAAARAPASDPTALAQVVTTEISLALSRHPVPIADGLELGNFSPTIDAGALAAQTLLTSLCTVVAPEATIEEPLTSLDAAPHLVPHQRAADQRHEVRARLTGDPDDLRLLRSELSTAGDSLVIDGPDRDRAWQIHLHADRPDLINELCRRYGTLLTFDAQPVHTLRTTSTGSAPERRVLIAGEGDLTNELRACPTEAHVLVLDSSITGDSLRERVNAVRRERPDLIIPVVRVHDLDRLPQARALAEGTDRLGKCVVAIRALA
ncbi:DAK2 domain-containing protein [Actinoplanes auranticolor]|uniref:DhaL domain-containing protein n=1 Tax=Actinoplanes auranticolor TaxID=47988 RepID=A0A919SQG6_9ACTN|nr:DAK2 domain-containing protein [Actinoplanes auranticolor]GIM74958.1 hypothetical protein Aau02nite_63570 [Actinoplanes auranticolor]